MLRHDLFIALTEIWGEVEIDLFASRINRQVSKYISLNKEPDCFAIDAFSVNWNQFSLCYTFPPFNLIGKVLQKCRNERANLLIIVPNWPTQYWYPLLKDLAVRETNNPFTLPVGKDIVTLPYKSDTVHPIWQKLNLLCFRINGNP